MTETGAETALRRVLPLFETRGTCVGCVPYGCGHINLTYRVWTDTGAEYILQRINGHVFRDIPGLMENIARVTAWLRRSCADSRRVLTLVPAVNGDSAPFTYRPGGLPLNVGQYAGSIVNHSEKPLVVLRRVLYSATTPRFCSSVRMPRLSA